MIEMNHDLINTIGIKQIAREEAHLYQVSDVQGLIDTLDKDISEWSDFDCWENIRVQQWIFERAMDIHKGKKIDICLLYTSPSPRDATLSRMPSSA